MIGDYLIAALLLLGGAFLLIGSIGLARMPDFFTRLHAPTKATTLGIGAIVVASMLHHSLKGSGLSLRELAISLFLFITAPLVGHVLAKAALRRRQ
jgi:multicomponent K+:H+ antiporter subunit G